MTMAKRAFFSFHYQDVIDFRANVVRNHWVTKEHREHAGFFDASLWENSRRRGDDSIKQLINNGLDGTSVTVVLIGDQTYDRRWVRYEIIRSVQRGNKIFGVHVNPIKDRYERIKAQGLNPFEFLALKYASNGSSIYALEHRNGSWKDYQDYTYSIGKHDHANFFGKSLKLTQFYPVYDWISDDGYNNFASWVDG